MIHGKPNLIYGDGAKPASGGTARARTSSPGQGTNFASMLSQEQNTRQMPMIAPSKPLAPGLGNGASLPQSAPARTPLPRVDSPASGRLSFGMEDTRKQGDQSLAMTENLPSRGRSSRSGSQSVSQTGAVPPARAARPVAAEPFKGVATEVNLSAPPKRGLSIFRDTNGSLAMQVGKQRMQNHEVSLLTGDSTQALLQVFHEKGRRPSPPLAPPVVAQARPAPARPAPANPPLAPLPALTAAAAPAKAAPLAQTRTQEPVLIPPVHIPAKSAPVLPDLSGGKAGQTDSVGFLAAKFESGEQGIAAIGYDSTGGTSYGKYQISSKAGTMAKFIRYLDEAAPDIARKLSQAGPANTGGRAGKMPQTWKAIAAAEPTRFEQLQTDFIMGSHFQPAMSSIAEATGVAFGALPPALQEVVFSTAVQHGPNGAARIVSTAVNKVGADNLTQPETSLMERTGQELIRQIYDLRSRQFGSSTSRVRAAVQSRLRTEMQDALNLLGTAGMKVSERQPSGKPQS